jgi:hypothetical protein
VTVTCEGGGGKATSLNRIDSRKKDIADTDNRHFDALQHSEPKGPGYTQVIVEEILSCVGQWYTTETGCM